MSGNYLLDTNVLIYILEQKAPPQRGPIKGRLHVSVITLGELHYGAHNSKWIARNIARVNALVAQLKLVRCTKGTAEHYAVVKKKLLAKARPVSPNDMWIAATAIQHGLTLVTNDHHFSFVDDILLEAW